MNYENLFTHEYCIDFYFIEFLLTIACKWCVPSAFDFFLLRNNNSGGKTREASEGVEYDLCLYNV
jgi:hypothetical protein